MLALSLSLTLLLATIEGEEPNPPPSYGKQLYITYCATCHASNFTGTANGPPLRGVGMASVDFELVTGRMPAAVPWLEVAHRGQQLSSGDIRAIEAYLAPAAGDPQIPTVVAGGNREHGRRLYELNCEHCHGVQGNGGAIGGLDWVPSLHRASITQVAEAIRVGPGQMPRFGEHQIPQDDLNDVSTYVFELDTNAQPANVPPFRSSGPVPEGAIGWLGIVLLLIFVFSFWRSETPPAERTETKRPEEDVHPLSS